MTTTTRSNKRPKRATTRSSTTRSWPKNATLDFVSVSQHPTHKCRLPEPSLCFTNDWLLAACPISFCKIQVTAWNKHDFDHPSSMSLDVSKAVVSNKSFASGEPFVIDQVGFLSTKDDNIYLQVSLHNVPGLLLMEIDVTGENLIGEMMSLVAPAPQDLTSNASTTDLGLLTSDGILASIVRTAHNKQQTAVLFDFRSSKCLGTYVIPLLDKDETASWIRSGDDDLLLWISNEESSSAVSSLLAWNGTFPLSFQNIRLPPNIMAICPENPQGLLAVSKTKAAVPTAKKSKKGQHALDQSGIAVLWLDLEQCKATTAGQACFSSDLNPGWGHSSHNLMWHPQEHHVLAVHNHSPTMNDSSTPSSMVGFAVDSETGKPVRYQTSNNTKTKQLIRTANTGIYQHYLNKGRTIASVAGNVVFHKEEHVLAYVDWNVERVPGDDSDDQPFDDYQYQTVFQVHLVSLSSS